MIGDKALETKDKALETKDKAERKRQREKPVENENVDMKELQGFENSL